MCPSQAKEAELLQINKLLEDSNLTVSKYQQWKEHNEELVQEIERVAKVKASKAEDSSPVRDMPPEEIPTEAAPAAETEGAYRLSLSDGEQLVDAEPSDVHLEIPKAPPSPDGSPVLELSLGSLQDSINKELNEMGVSGNAAENYFYI